MWSRIIGIAIVIAIAAAAAWALWPRPITVETAAIGINDLEVTVEEDGISQIREVFHVSLPVTGRLTRVGLHAGDSVMEGQTIAQIRSVPPGLLDERSRRIARAGAEAALAAIEVAKASLAQATAINDFAQRELERTLALADRGLVSAQVAQKATLEAKTAQEALDAARASLLMHQRELESAQAGLLEGVDSTVEQCCVELKAPASGRVLSVLTESEQVMQAGTPLMDIGDPTDLEVEVDVLSSDAVRIVPGAAAMVKDWGGDPLPAQVARIDPLAITKVSALGIDEQRTSVLLRLLGDPKTRAGLGHGYRVTASIVVWQGKGLVTVPLGALFRTGQDWTVFVVEEGVARLRILQVGQRNTEQAAVISGLAKGETVILHPGDTVFEGRSVTPEG
ncbi:MAG TPA: HlyD family efflux transporter periplasmic adaptor subunit [Devosia sp.]|nr:HlyD family efflux transporter periplasmic adaptor subunit [Devosia sp.]